MGSFLTSLPASASSSILPLKRPNDDETVIAISEKLDSASVPSEQCHQSEIEGEASPPLKKLATETAQLSGPSHDEHLEAKDQDSRVEVDDFKVDEVSEHVSPSLNGFHLSPQHDSNPNHDLSTYKEDSKKSAEQLSRLATIRRQIEYYFSDDNLRYDEFFRGKMDNPPSEEFRGWLSVTIILNAPRMMNLKCTPEDVEEALKDSFLLKKMDDTGLGWISRTGELPPLEKRPHSIPHHKRKARADIHAAGCLLILTGIPEEVGSWQVVKSAVKEILPEKAVIKFVTSIRQNGSCKIWVKSFDNDKAFFKEKEVKINGKAVKIALLEDEAEIKAFLSFDMPIRLRHEREKLIARNRSNLLRKPLIIADQRFDNMDHLRKCVEELLEKTEENTQLKQSSVAETVVKGLLDYHPSISYKLGGSNGEFVGIKVVQSTEENMKKQRKCFALVKKMNENSIVEPFRIDKCLQEVSRNPPIAPEMEKMHETVKEKETSS